MNESYKIENYYRNDNKRIHVNSTHITACIVYHTTF